jgi:hypothetical protein
MRVNAELDRLRDYREKANQSSLLYYKVLTATSALIKARMLSVPGPIRFMTDSMKNVIEYGGIFNEDHLISIFEQLSASDFHSSNVRK